MATIRLHGKKWQARVYKKGYPTAIRSFLIRKDAEKWARQIEAEMDKGSYINTALADKTIACYVKAASALNRGLAATLCGAKAVPLDY